MRLLLIRHGETVDNVAALYAGSRDSALTNHGVLQADRLGAHLAATGVKISHIFSSDLQRAVRTADAVRLAQPANSPTPTEVTKLALIREQDFGFYEGKSFHRQNIDLKGKEADPEEHKSDPSFRDMESIESMRARTDIFIDEHLWDLFVQVQDEHCVAVVAHGAILGHLWRGILRRFSARDVSVAPGAVPADAAFSLEYIGRWSNTGYMDLEINPKLSDQQRASTTDASAAMSRPSEEPSLTHSKVSYLQQEQPTQSLSPVNSPDIPQLSSPKSHTLMMVVKAVNSRQHLTGLKKTGGGLGSLKHDTSQKTMDSFFKKSRTERHL